MKIQNVIVPKEFEITRNGQVEKKTKWNRVGHAWKSNAGRVSFELYMFPGHRFVIEAEQPEQETQNNQEAQ